MPPVRELRRFTFDSIMFRMVCAREGFYLDQQIHYSELFSVCETDKFFFITIEKGKIDDVIIMMKRGQQE